MRLPSRPQPSIILLFTLGLGLAGACATAVPRPTPELLSLAKTRYPDLTLDELREGRRAYVTRCSGCHTLYGVAEFSPEQWVTELDNMEQEVEVRLTAKERYSIERYLTAVSSALRTKTARAVPSARGSTRAPVAVE